MNFDPTAEQTAFLDELRAVLAERVTPNAVAWDRAGTIPADALSALAACGANGIYAPKEHGGRGLDTVSYALAMEEIGAALPGLAIVLSVVNSLVGHPIARFGTAEQKERFLRPLARGERLGAFCLTEAEAGSDATHLATRAVRDGDAYTITGEKVMVTNGGTAALLLVIAATDPSAGGRGLSAFLVDGDAPGVTRGPRDETLGLHAADVRPLRFQNVRVGTERRLGDEGQGISVLLEGLNAGRIGVGGQATGIARGALALAVDHARTRRQFEKTLAEIPMVQQMLAVMASETDVARLLVLEAAQKRDRGEPFAADASRAKLAASEAAVRVASSAIQVFGGWGYLTATGVERFYRDAKATELYEGTSEIQRTVIAGALARA